MIFMLRGRRADLGSHYGKATLVIEKEEEVPYISKPIKLCCENRGNDLLIFRLMFFFNSSIATLTVSTSNTLPRCRCF